MSNQETIQGLKEELDIEAAAVNVLESGAFSTLEKIFKEEVYNFEQVLYNEGKASKSEKALTEINEARIEIYVRKKFLDFFYDSRNRYSKVQKDLREKELI